MFFPCLEKVRTKFPVFPVPWPPCYIIYILYNITIYSIIYFDSFPFFSKLTFLFDYCPNLHNSNCLQFQLFRSKYAQQQQEGLCIKIIVCLRNIQAKLERLKVSFTKFHHSMNYQVFRQSPKTRVMEVWA